MTDSMSMEDEQMNDMSDSEMSMEDEEVEDYGYEAELQSEDSSMERR